jgi:hypothetical protein
MKFYVLDSMIGSDTETSYEPVDKKRGEAPRCPVCNGYIGLKMWLPPYVVNLDLYGSPIGDVAFGTGNDLLVSDRFVDAWRSEQLRGVDAFDPVDIVRVKGNRKRRPVPSYFHIAPPRTEARIDKGRSKIVHDGPVTCDLCGGAGIDAILELCIDESSWCGEDIFIPWGMYGVTVVTERVLSLASQYELKNVTTTPIESFRRDHRTTQRD